MFQTVTHPKSLPEACGAAIREVILRRRLQPGDRLPPERELCQELGVNRTTLRAALAQLGREGLLTARQGSGHVVTDYRRHGGPQLIPELLALLSGEAPGADVVRDVLAIRRALAAVVLERLEDKAPSKSALAELDRTIDHFEALAGEHPLDFGQLARADLAVLRAIVEATDSAVFSLFLNPIADIVGKAGELCAVMYGEPMTNVLGYRALARALRERAAVRTLALELLAERDTATVATLRKTRRVSR